MIINEIKELLSSQPDMCDEKLVALITSLSNKEEAKNFVATHTKKILVIGEVNFKEAQLNGFLKSVNISKERLEFKTGYHAFKQKSLRSYQYNDNYALILVRAMPHSTKDMGNFSSIISAMEREEGWPPVIRLGGKGLKGTLSNAKRAIYETLDCGILVAA